MRCALIFAAGLALVTGLALPACQETEPPIEDSEYDEIFALPAEAQLSAMTDAQINDEITNLQNRMIRLSKLLADSSRLDDEQKLGYQQRIIATDRQLKAYQAEQDRRRGNATAN